MNKIFVIFLIIFACSNLFAVSLSEMQNYFTSVGYENVISGDSLVVTSNSCFQKYVKELIDFLKMLAYIMIFFVILKMVFDMLASGKQINFAGALVMITVCLITMTLITPVVEFITNTKISYECEPMRIKISDIQENKSISDLIKYQQQ